VGRWARVLLLGAALGFGAPEAAQAQAAPVMPSVPSDVSLGVVVVRATREGRRLDPRLAQLAQHLERMPFTAFDLVQEHRWRLHDRGRQDIALPDGRTTTLVLLSHNGDEAKVAVSSRRPGADPVETVLTIHRDRAFVYALRTGPDAALLLRVDVHY
jgi:hypothetical protein